MPKRKQHRPEFKAKVRLEALKGELTVSRPAGQSVRFVLHDDPSMEAGLA